MAVKTSNSFIGKYVIIRTYSAGVHVGTLVSQNGKEVMLKDTRRIWSGEGAFTLSAIAMNGLGKNSRLSVVVPELMLTEAIEIIPTSPEAEAQLKNHREYKS